jgi:hypothetical protein
MAGVTAMALRAWRWYRSSPSIYVPIDSILIAIAVVLWTA